MLKNNTKENRRMWLTVRFYLLPLVLGALVVLVGQVLLPQNAQRNMPYIQDLRVIYNAGDTIEHPQGLYYYDFEKSVLEKTHLPIIEALQPTQISNKGTLVFINNIRGLAIQAYWAQNAGFPLAMPCTQGSISPNDTYVACVGNDGQIYIGDRLDGNPTLYFSEAFPAYDPNTDTMTVLDDYMVIMTKRDHYTYRVANHDTRQIVMDKTVSVPLLFSPDGKYYTYSSLADLPDLTIMVGDVVTGEEVAYTYDLPRSTTRLGQVLAWSPDHQHLVITGYNGNDTMDLYAYDFSDSALSTLTNRGYASVNDADYDASGTKITYTVYNGSDYEVWFMDLADKIPYFVDYGRNPHFVTEPDWMND